VQLTTQLLLQSNSYAIIIQAPRLAVKKNPGAPEAFLRRPLPRRTALDYANGTGIEYSCDTAGRLLYLDNQTDSGQHKYGYTYDHVGNWWSMSVTDASGTKKKFVTVTRQFNPPVS
jgi:hypothetical protein